MFGKPTPENGIGENAMMEINGKQYPPWSQFVERKEEWIGGTLEDNDMGMTATTEITNITLTPNGEDSAYFSVDGVDFGCGFDVKYGGISGGGVGFGWITLSGYGGHSWRIKQKGGKP